MPKQDPVKQEKDPMKQPEIEVVSEEHKPEEVEVNLDPQKETPAPDPTEKLRNQMFYEMRQQEKKNQAYIKQVMEEMVQRISGNTQPQKGSEELDEFDAEVERIAQTDWRKAVDMRAERIAEKKLEEKLRAQEELKKQENLRDQAIRIEARGREKVLAQFPDILDESSPEFRQYMEIYNREVSEDPMFVYNPRKHEIILPELREKMKGKSYDVNPEIERLKRVAAGTSTPSRPSSSDSKKIMLTQEEIQMCKRSGIPVETYARTKNLGAAGLKEGVVVDE